MEGRVYTYITYNNRARSTAAFVLVFYIPAIVCRVYSNRIPYRVPIGFIRPLIASGKCNYGEGKSRIDWQIKNRSIKMCLYFL